MIKHNKYVEKYATFPSLNAFTLAAEVAWGLRSLIRG
jgi:hypothetical protein